MHLHRLLQRPPPRAATAAVVAGRRLAPARRACCDDRGAAAAAAAASAARRGVPRCCAAAAARHAPATAGPPALPLHRPAFAHEQQRHLCAVRRRGGLVPAPHAQQQRQQQHRWHATLGAGAAAEAQARPQQQRPIVVVAGWLGAPERPFNKYVDLWERRLGAGVVLRARPNPAALIVPAYGDAAAARDAAALAAAAAAAPGAPVLLHLFSGGGFLYSGLMLRALQRRRALEPVAARIAGVVLDSSPAFVTADVSARALLAAALREPAGGVEGRHPRLLGAVRGAVEAYLLLPPTRRRIAETEAAWHALTPPCPKLYLYSESDVLVSPETIQRHMQAEAVRGARVYAHKWADTPHVEHYRLHPEQYATLVERFVGEALALQAASASEGSAESSGEWDGAGGGSAASSSSLSSSASGGGASERASSVGSGGGSGSGGGGGRDMWMRREM
ncbi:hypothetical protein Rsub_06692 [Raphidocelis subcapitata]|uniref:Uncharacterized protein n=1 Tax=Raphidocelis subcapitata TaxID=307507 RepID=A0A2V0PBN2_9CHLO|nr:hypothetical protein Rsub_06692 [Raphidocelis subcapitata]|eukprot:GBF94577.1 hypothetical protein Rsub_06692 [Raphidocelis subcapitata]